MRGGSADLGQPSGRFGQGSRSAFDFNSQLDFCRVWFDVVKMGDLGSNSVLFQVVPSDQGRCGVAERAEILNYIHGTRDRFDRPRGYVGDLKFNRKVEWKGSVTRIGEVAAQIDPDLRKTFHRGRHQQWYFTATLHIPEVNPKVRVVIIWDKKRDQAPCKILVTNRVAWEVVRILLVYRYRWTGTETFHRDGKQELGMGDCQLRDGQGQTRHMYLVMLAYTLLMDQRGQNRAKAGALRKLTTIGEACRAVLRETLRSTIAWAIEQATEYSHGLDHITARLRLT